MPKYLRAIASWFNQHSLNRLLFVRWVQGGHWLKCDDVWYKSELVILTNNINGSTQRYYSSEHGMVHETFVGIQALENHDG